MRLSSLNKLNTVQQNILGACKVSSIVYMFPVIFQDKPLWSTKMLKQLHDQLKSLNIYERNKNFNKS